MAAVSLNGLNPFGGLYRTAPEGVPDLRGLWADAGHVERIEQCGNLVIIVGDTYTHGVTPRVWSMMGSMIFGDGTCSTPIAVAFYEGDALYLLKR